VTTPFDYDANPERFRLASRVTQQHLTTRSLYDHLAEVLVGMGVRRILDIGCGEGALRAALPARLRSRVVGLDASRTMLGAHPPPVVQADATALPFPPEVFGAAVAVNVLDHLPDPTVAIAEAGRVLAPGGWFVAATASRHDAPELAHVWRRHRSVSTRRTALAWWRRYSGRSGWSGGTRHCSACRTAGPSATT
jgi:SAM-dependent methyltransferase